MMLRNFLFIGSLSLLLANANAATILGITDIAEGVTDTDTGAHLTVVMLSWDDGLGATPTGLGQQSAELPNGVTVTEWAYTDEAAGTTAGGTVTPLIFAATTGGDYTVFAIGDPNAGTPGGGAFVPTAGSATIPATNPAGITGYFPGFYMEVPDSGGGNHAPIGFVGELGGGPANDGMIAFDNTTAGAPAHNSTITLNGLSPLDRTYNFSVTIPEPSSALLGLLGLGLFIRRRR